MLPNARERSCLFIPLPFCLPIRPLTYLKDRVLICNRVYQAAGTNSLSRETVAQWIVAKWMAASYRNIIIDSSDQLKLSGKNHKEDTTYLPDKHKYPPPAPHQNSRIFETRNAMNGRDFNKLFISLLRIQRFDTHLTQKS